MWQLMLAYCVHARQCAKLFSGILCSQPPRSLGNEYTNGRPWGHFAFLEATELNRTEVQVHTLRQLWNSLAWCAVPPAERRRWLFEPPLRCTDQATKARQKAIASYQVDWL